MSGALLFSFKCILKVPFQLPPILCTETICHDPNLIREKRNFSGQHVNLGYIIKNRETFPSEQETSGNTFLTACCNSDRL